MSKNIPTNKKLYARVKAEAKRKFDRWPSAYGSAWLVREYKKRGGGYRKAEMGMEVENPYADMYSIGGGIMIDDYEMGYGGMPEYKSGGGIPQRYKNKGFTKVGAKKKSTRPGKKWMVLAKKGDKYKVVHGGDSNMKDFSQHGSAKRKKRFWDRMGGKSGPKAQDPFSPLYWHKRFGTWAEGGEMEFEPHMMYDPETGKGYMAEKYEDHLKMDKMGFGHDAPEMGYGGYQYGNGGYKYAKGGTNNPGFKALPDEVQAKILANMMYGGDLYKMGGMPCYECGGMAAEGMEVQELANVPRKNTPGELSLAPVFDPREFPTPMTEEPTSVENPSYGNAFAGKYTSGYLFKNGKFNPTLQVQTPGMDEALQFGTMDALAGVSRIAGAMGRNKKESRQLQENKRRQFSDNLYDPISAGAMGSRGDYNLMGEFRPDRVGNWNPYMAESFNTGSFYKEGGETEMTDEEIARLRAMGADIEILD